MRRFQYCAYDYAMTCTIWELFKWGDSTIVHAIVKWVVMQFTFKFYGSLDVRFYGLFLTIFKCWHVVFQINSCALLDAIPFHLLTKDTNVFKIGIDWGLGAAEVCLAHTYLRRLEAKVIFQLTILTPIHKPCLKEIDIALKTAHWTSMDNCIKLIYFIHMALYIKVHSPIIVCSDNVE